MGTRSAEYDADIAKMYGTAGPRALWGWSLDKRVAARAGYGVGYYPTGEGGDTEPEPTPTIPVLSEAYFTDTFDRADSTTVGNNWTENIDGSYEIVGNDLQLNALGSTTDSAYQVLQLARPNTDQVLDQGYEFVIPAGEYGDIIYGIAGRWQATDKIADGDAGNAENTFHLIGVRKDSSTTTNTEFYTVTAGSVSSVATQLANTVPSNVDLLVRVSITGATTYVVSVFNNVTHELLFERGNSTTGGPQVAGRFSLITWGRSSAIGSTLMPKLQLHDLSTNKKVALLGDSVLRGTTYTAEENTWRAKLTRELGIDVTSYYVSGATITVGCPDGYVPPSDWDVPDTTNNVTKAIADGADMVVISYVSNYVKRANGEGQVGVDNYIAAAQAIVQACIDAGVEYRIFHTLPRSVTDIQRQTLRDTAAALTTEFGEYTLELYDTISTADNFFKAEYDSGDGVHPNAAGHNVFYELVSKSLRPDGLKWV